MTNKELFTTYREVVLDLQELSSQLEKAGRDGRPQGVGTPQTEPGRRTNDAMAAAMQAMDGIGEMLERKRDELAGLAGPVSALMSRIGDAKTFLVIQRYYLMGKTDSAIASDLCISRARVNQIRNNYFAQIC